MVLGNTQQHIVTEDEETAKELIEYLRERNMGRATFLPMTTVRPRLLTPQEKEVLSMPGCLGVASDLGSTYREITVAMAAPSTPMAGAPRWPKISTQLPNRLVRMAQIPANIGARVSPASRSVPA